MRERTQLDTAITAFRGLEAGLEDAATLIDLGEAEEDEDSVAEGMEQLRALKAETDRRQLESLLSGEADAND